MIDHNLPNIVDATSVTMECKKNELPPSYCACYNSCPETARRRMYISDEIVVTRTFWRLLPLLACILVWLDFFLLLACVLLPITALLLLCTSTRRPLLFFRFFLRFCFAFLSCLLVLPLLCCQLFNLFCSLHCPLQNRHGSLKREAKYCYGRSSLWLA